MPRDPGTGVYTLPAPNPIQPRLLPVTNVYNLTMSDLADALNNIPGGAIQPGSITTTELADGAVTEPKLATDAVTTDKIVDGAVTEPKLATDAVTTDKIVDGAVTNAKTDLTNLLIRGTAGGTYGSSWVGFYNEDLSSRWGYVGKGSPGTQDVYLEANVGRIRLNPSAADPVVTLTSGQLQFPTTQNPSTDPNTLDDYEEGTWTPTLEFVTPGNTSITYSQRLAKYTKIGDMVHVQALINTSTFTHTTASGYLNITGLPFPVGNSNGIFAALGVYGRGFIWEPTYFHSFSALATGSIIAMYLVGGGLGGSTTATRISEARHTSGANVEIIVGGTYKV